MIRLNQLAINDEGFVFDPSTGESFTVNPSGLFILNQLKSGKSPEEIAEALKTAFEDVPELAERDVADFVAHLKTYRLL